jgi:3-phosphoshikimate 1-carboxyvinyltransferase
MRWPAPLAVDPVDATVRVPGSKSITNRALVLAALAPGESRLRGALRSRDTGLMAGALRALGVPIVTDADEWVVTGGALSAPDATIDVGNAGTVARFIPPVAALAAGDVRLDGDPRIRQRPLAPLVAALRALGVRVDASDTDGLPLTVQATRSVAGGAVSVDASSSSQIVSGLLLAAARYDAGLAVEHVGSPLPSVPHLDMTVAMLRTAGVTVDVGPGERWRVHAGGLSPRVWDVEPDLSSAAPFLAAALATGGRVRVVGWPSQTTQPGGRLPELLREMGGSAQQEDDGLVVTGAQRIRGVDLDLHDVGELTPVIAALAALADGESRLRGVAHLRRHETDRLAALAREINALGGDVRETDDGLVVSPRPLHGGTFATYDDHRMAMAGAVIGLVVRGVVLDDVATTSKTLPEFAAMWAAMLDGRGAER